MQQIHGSGGGALSNPVVTIDYVAQLIGVSPRKASEYAADGTLAKWGMVPFKAGSRRSPWLVRVREVDEWLARKWQEAGGAE